jgi:hypothetical protein
MVLGLLDQGTALDAPGSRRKSLTPRGYEPNWPDLRSNERACLGQVVPCGLLRTGLPTCATLRTGGESVILRPVIALTPAQEPEASRHPSRAKVLRGARGAPARISLWKEGLGGATGGVCGERPKRICSFGTRHEP